MVQNINDIKVEVNYPEDEKLIDDVEGLKAKCILQKHIEIYGEESIIDIYEVFISIKKLEVKEGISFSEAKLKILNGKLGVKLDYLEKKI